MTRTTAQNTDRSYRDNCLSLVKLIAALQVMLGHLQLHLQLPKIPRYLISYFNGVPIFFVISGFLISFSVKTSASYKEYLKKRFWRIYPELWLAVAFEIISIVIFYRSFNAKHLAVFTFTQATFFQFWTPNSLRGYGCGTPNGALWTICVMIQFYIIAWLIRKFMNKRKWYILAAVNACLILASIIGHFAAEKLGSEILLKLYGQTIIRYCWLFFFGCFLAEFKDKALPFISKYFYVFLVAAIIPFVTRVDIYAGYNVLWSLLLVTGLIGFAYRFPKLALRNDISYGIFLWHMIIVNIFITKGWTGSWGYGMAVAVLTIICSYISFRTVGSWSSKMKKMRTISRNTAE
ncbi:MAG: acyltransferase [Ruminococcus sp.]|uniref:acyltransferase family protein n=1 Tax=Ruminococcus sp. TaxID=41978 RepID=UPI0025CE6571|nr:acyltransferase [Ruminococcus sp.]MCR5600131.1 acyltransferase [Ruminococcus sp.]